MTQSNNFISTKPHSLQVLLEPGLNTTDRIASQTDQEYASFASLPLDLRDSSIAYISSIHSKLETLGCGVLPAGSCSPERRVAAFTASEVECLAILEHRRWPHERQKGGWRYGTAKDVERQRSPCMVPWEELPDRAARPCAAFPVCWPA